MVRWLPTTSHNYPCGSLMIKCCISSQRLLDLVHMLFVIPNKDEMSLNKHSSLITSHFLHVIRGTEHWTWFCKQSVSLRPLSLYIYSTSISHAAVILNECTWRWHLHDVIQIDTTPNFMTVIQHLHCSLSLAY